LSQISTHTLGLVPCPFAFPLPAKTTMRCGAVQEPSSPAFPLRSSHGPPTMRCCSLTDWAFSSRLLPSRGYRDTAGFSPCARHSPVIPLDHALKPLCLPFLPELPCAYSSRACSCTFFFLFIQRALGSPSFPCRPTLVESAPNVRSSCASQEENCKFLN